MCIWIVFTFYRYDNVLQLFAILRCRCFVAIFVNQVESNEYRFNLGSQDTFGVAMAIMNATRSPTIDDHVPAAPPEQTSWWNEQGTMRMRYRNNKKPQYY